MSVNWNEVSANWKNHEKRDFAYRNDGIGDYSETNLVARWLGFTCKHSLELLQIPQKKRNSSGRYWMEIGRRGGHSTESVGSLSAETLVGSLH